MRNITNHEKSYINFRNCEEGEGLLYKKIFFDVIENKTELNCGYILKCNLIIYDNFFGIWNDVLGFFASLLEPRDTFCYFYF